MPRQSQRRDRVTRDSLLNETTSPWHAGHPGPHQLGRHAASRCRARRPTRSPSRELGGGQVLSDNYTCALTTTRPVHPGKG